MIIFGSFWYILGVIALLGHLWNKGKLCRFIGFHKTDSGSAWALTNFAFMVSDLTLDILLVIKIFREAAEREVKFGDVFSVDGDQTNDALFLCWIGTLAFLVFPYVTNIFTT